MFLAHVNLNDEYLPYKHIIGQLIQDVSICIVATYNSVSQEIRKIRK